MLRIIYGRAGTGKTHRIMSEIAHSVRQRGEFSILLVPEQYSHETERELARICGPSLSLYAEVLSFTRLANRVFTECGGLYEPMPDKGGQILLMSLALKQVSGGLRIYSRQAGKSEFLRSLLETRSELVSAMISPDNLLAASERTSGTVADKLYDMSLICSSYETLLKERFSGFKDIMTRLRENIGVSSIGSLGKIYIDGFSDFTAQELRVIEELLKKDADITVALCMDADSSELFRVPLNTFFSLLEMAKKHAVGTETLCCEVPAGLKRPELLFFEKYFYSTTLPEVFEGKAEAIEVYSANDTVSECEIAAAKILSLLKHNPTLRLSDFAVAARGFSKYEAICEATFARYGLPVYSGKKTDIMQKPVMTLISEAFEILNGNWQYVNVFRYLKTGLAGITREDCDILENYCLSWNLRGQTVWMRDAPWNYNPRGYVSEATEADYSVMAKVDRIRRSLMLPLKNLHERGSKAVNVAEHIGALYEYMRETLLAERLEEKSTTLIASGERQLAAEYSQLWDILMDALEQFYETLGDVEMGREEFSSLLMLMLSQYEVATIPVALDRVLLCDLDRLRGRKLKNLIVLGATDENMPLFSGDSGLFSSDERREITAAGLSVRNNSDDEVSRELFTIYSALAAPSEYLILSMPYSNGESKTRPAFAVGRACKLFGLDIGAEDEHNARTYAAVPAFQLALSDKSKTGASAGASLESIDGWAERLSIARERAAMPRGSLSGSSVRILYGEESNISATRAESFINCRFSYFMQYGLRAKPRRKLAFEAPELGTLVHFILEGVSREVKDLGGFREAGLAKCKELTAKYMDIYTRELLGKTKKSERFIYLFTRLKGMVERIVEDTAAELMNSGFEPLDFELHFAKDGDLPPAEIGVGDTGFTLSGYVDRVDGYVSGGKLYLRVCDYKTGRREFNLTDVYYGLGLQMLIYLFVLQARGKERYGMDIEPAGVLYTPAREILMPMPRGASEKEIERERFKRLKRSGLILDDPEIIAAMEDPQKRLPAILKDGVASGSIASLEQFGKLSAYIERTLVEMGEEMKKGSINANPFSYAGIRTGCAWCPYADACSFREDLDTERPVKRIEKDKFWESI